MIEKAFQTVVVILLIVFTSALIIVLFSGLLSFPGAFFPHSDGIVAVTGGVSTRIFNLFLIAIALAFVGVFLVWRALRKRT